MGRKLLSLIFALFCIAGIQAQQQSKLDIALRYVEQNANKWNLTKSDYSDMVLTDISTDARLGATYVYFNQASEGILLKNAILNLTIDRNGKVVYAVSNFTPDLKSKVVGNRASLKVEDAIVAAAKHLGVTNAVKPISLGRNDQGKITFQAVPYADSPITAELVYDMKDGKAIPTWQATMDMAANADYWEIRMDATDGSFVSKNNLTVYCSHHKGKYAKHKGCESEMLAKRNDDKKTIAEALSVAASYRVYALPAESPIHGAQVLIPDPSFVEVSPFGWHDTDGVEGAEYTITRGNNVYTYTDKNDDDSPDTDVAQPNGGATLTFDFAHDKNKEPLQNADAVQTNLFYLNNMMHDITALYGFDEESGNFQSFNYSGKGKGNDYVLAQAFDGFDLSTPSLNNANFSTPADGSSGRMQMFLWSAAAGAVSIDDPAQIAGFVDEYGTAQFGDPIPTSSQPALTAKVDIARDADPSSPTACCNPIIKDLTGRIALIDRGLCDFSKKVYNAQTKGAVAALICNISGVNGGNGDELLNMASGDNGGEVTIPSIFMKKTDCDRIRASIISDIDVTMTLHERMNSGPDFLDGAFDNGIISHEYAHGISNRLTGGPSAAGCLNNEEQMGEGWSDFFSLVVTVEPGDKGTDIRGIGNFAVSNGVNGGGIRRYPYSTDMTVSPQTYNSIKGTPEVHNTGEIWTCMLWDLYWAFVDKYGYDADWRNFDSGNAKALKLVIQGMKMQGCNPGFVRGRDAILAADSLCHNGDNTYMIWDVFARRGLGFYADGGDIDDVNDGSENFDPHPLSVEQLKISKTATESVDAGQDIQVTLHAINHVPSKQSGVVITDDLPDGATFIASSASRPGTVDGNKIKFEIGDMEYKEELTITYKLSTSASNTSNELVNYDFEDDFEWEVVSLKGTAFWYQTDIDRKSGEISFFVPDEAAENDHSLVSPVLNIQGDLPVLRFWHKFDTQAGIDGGFIQIATAPNYNVWATVKDGFLRNGYNNVIGYSTFAIPALNGFTGSSEGQFIDSYLDLSAYKGQDIKVRFRFGSDETISVPGIIAGWYMDDVAILDLKKYEGFACITNGDNSKGTCSAPTRTVVNGMSTSIDEPSANDYEMAIYPNPANTSFTISAKSDKSETAFVAVRSVDGKEVFNTKMPLSTNTSVMNVDASHFVPGLYIVTVQNGDKVSSRKLFIN